MTKLMKYEFRKTWITKVILLGITAAAEIAYLIALYTNHENTMIGMAGLLTVLAVGGVLVIGLESVLTLHRDMNTKQGYMLFMTPNSCYRILGAKVLECALSVLLTGAFYFALGALDISLLLTKYGEINQLWEMIQSFLEGFTVNGQKITIDAVTLAAAAFSLLTGWILTIITAYLADVISAAVLNGKSYNGVISFALFLALSWLTGWASRLLTGGINGTVPMMLAYGVVNLVLGAVMYVVTAQIMERKLSV